MTPRYEFRDNFPFPRHCGIGNFRLISLQTLADFYEMTDAEKVMNPQVILGRIQQISGSRLIRQSGLESRITFGLKFGVSGGLRPLSTVLLQMYYVFLFNNKIQLLIS